MVVYRKQTGGLPVLNPNRCLRELLSLLATTAQLARNYGSVSSQLRRSQLPIAAQLERESAAFAIVPCEKAEVTRDRFLSRESLSFGGKRMTIIYRNVLH